MGWVRISDDFYDNDKIALAGAHGLAVWISGLAFCNRNLTDGMIPRNKARALVDFTGCAVVTGTFTIEDDCDVRAIERLVALDLWHAEDHDCPDCPDPGPMRYIVHDYLKFQPSRAEIEERAEANRERVKRFRDARKAERQAGNALRNALGNAECNALVMPAYNTPQPQPQPQPHSSVDLGGELTQVGEPPKTCRRHPGGTEVPCGACAKARRAHEQWSEQHRQDELDERRRLRELRDNCPRCKGTNVVEVGPDKVAKCDHQEASHA